MCVEGGEECIDFDLHLANSRTQRKQACPGNPSQDKAGLEPWMRMPDTRSRADARARRALAVLPASQHSWSASRATQNRLQDPQRGCSGTVSRPSNLSALAKQHSFAMVVTKHPNDLWMLVKIRCYLKG